MAGTREQAMRRDMLEDGKEGKQNRNLHGGLHPSYPALLSACLSCIVVFGFL